MLLAFLVSLPLPASAQDSINERVLVLHGIWQADDWEESFNQALRASLNSSQQPIITVSHQYLGISVDRSTATYAHAVEQFKYLVEKHQISLVVSVLSAASQFLYDNGSELFPDLPKILVSPGADLENRGLDSSQFVIIRGAARKRLSKQSARFCCCAPRPAALKWWLESVSAM